MVRSRISKGETHHCIPRFVAVYKGCQTGSNKVFKPRASVLIYLPHVAFSYTIIYTVHGPNWILAILLLLLCTLSAILGEMSFHVGKTASSGLRLREINQWIANKANTSTRRILQIEIAVLVGFGFTLMQIGEWAAAIFCWVLLACILFVRLARWSGVIGQNGISLFLRIASYVGVIALCVLLITITALRRPDNEPWSNLQKLRLRAPKPGAAVAKSIPREDESRVTPDRKRCDDIITQGQIFDYAATPTGVKKTPNVELSRCRRKYLPDQLTLFDLFSTDFSAPPYTYTSSYAMKLTSKGEPDLVIDYLVVVQLSTANRFLSFYIWPTSEVFDAAIAVSANYRVALNDVWATMKVTGKAATGDSDAASSQDVVFSKRVFIYYENYLTLEQILKIEKVFKKQGLSVILRGSDYLENEKLQAKLAIKN
jgi:hypothetical protein